RVLPACPTRRSSDLVEIRRQLGLKSGDKILFIQNQNGEIVVSNASAAAIRKAQTAFAGAAEAMGVSSEDDIHALVDEVRHGKGRSEEHTSELQSRFD